MKQKSQGYLKLSESNAARTRPMAYTFTKKIEYDRLFITKLSFIILHVKVLSSHSSFIVTLV